MPSDTFGNHLNKSNKSTDIELEKKNFNAAGEILTSVWSETVIDGHQVIAEFLPAGAENDFINRDQVWVDEQSKYLLQIVKCIKIVLAVYQPIRTTRAF